MKQLKKCATERIDERVDDTAGMDLLEQLEEAVVKQLEEALLEQLEEGSCDAA